MREATKEERESVNNYIKSISTVKSFKDWFAENKDNLNIPRLEDLPEDDEWFDDEWEQYDERH